jgi:penicillin-binding protein 1C
VRIREALASSYNVPAVQVASTIGAGTLLEALHRAGFESLRQGAEHYGLGLALGNGDVTLIELTNAYRSLANGGEWRPWTWRLTSGRSASETKRVMSPMAASIVLDILSDATARIPGFGTSTPFDFPFPTAVKTGTSRHFTDNWAVATTRRFTVGVWVGNFNGRPMEGVSGVTGAGPLLHRAVMVASSRVPPGALVRPAELGAAGVPVCRLSGLRATDGCAHLVEWFAPGTQPTRDDDWERGGIVRLPDEYVEWAQNGLRPAFDRVEIAAATAPIPARAARDSVVSTVFRLISPLDGDKYSIPPGVESRYATISLRAAGVGAERVEWSIDGEPFSGERWPLAPGTHEVRAVSARGGAVRARIIVQR